MLPVFLGLYYSRLSTCVLHLHSYFEEPESLLAKSELICKNQAKKRI